MFLILLLLLGISVQKVVEGEYSIRRIIQEGNVLYLTKMDFGLGVSKVEANIK